MQQHDDALSDHTHRADILIVGAGMAGLTAATALQATGYSVRVIDKGRAVGGRLASRRIGAATFDHGAQFMTARDSRFAAMIDQWREAGVVEEWYRHSGEGSEGYPRWRGCPTMTAVAQHLARPLHLLVEKRVVALRRDPAGWVAALASGETLLAHAVLLTPPVPQSLALLDAGRMELPPATRTHLESIDYERCLAVMAVLDGPDAPSAAWRFGAHRRSHRLDRRPSEERRLRHAGGHLARHGGFQCGTLGTGSAGKRSDVASSRSALAGRECDRIPGSRLAVQQTPARRRASLLHPEKLYKN